MVYIPTYYKCHHCGGGCKPPPCRCPSCGRYLERVAQPRKSESKASEIVKGIGGILFVAFWLWLISWLI
jgi:hypothetical protein